MARMPGAAWRPLGPDPSIEGTMARYDILCYHTMVGSLWGTDAYFHRDGYGGTESHFGVGYNGEILQWQDTAYRADANLDGGDRVLSVETADMGIGFPAWSGENVPAWTDLQIEANARIAAWAHRTHGIPLVLIPNSAQSSRGLGWHRQGVDPWRCDSCERWSISSGKICPGDRRVAQMPAVLARAKQIVAGEGDDVTPEECEAVVRKVLGDENLITLDWDGGPPNARRWSMIQVLGKLIHFNAADAGHDGTVPETSVRADDRGRRTVAGQILDTLGSIDKRLTAVEAKLEPPPTEPVEPANP